MTIKNKISAISFLGIGTLVVITFAITSCDDSLDVRTPIDQINSVQVFESVSTADAALSNLYSEMQSYSLLSGGGDGAGALLSTYTDELINRDAYNSNADQDIYNNVLQASNTSIKSVWTNAYKEIYITNSIIEGVEKR